MARLITGSEGTFVTVLEAKMRLLRDFGRASGGGDNYLSVGWNLKFTDLQAVIGIAQMTRLEAEGYVMLESTHDDGLFRLRIEK